MFIHAMIPTMPISAESSAYSIRSCPQSSNTTIRSVVLIFGSKHFKNADCGILLGQPGDDRSVVQTQRIAHGHDGQHADHRDECSNQRVLDKILPAVLFKYFEQHLPH